MLVTLEILFKSVKARFKYMEDRRNPYQFNRVEHWLEPEYLDGVIQGDCEDFALACRKLCRAAEIPSRLWHCTTENGEAHLVLEAGGWILDNRQSHVRANQSLPYRWNAISGFEPGDPWHKTDQREGTNA